jgi:hypothetical protein
VQRMDGARGPCCKARRAIIRASCLGAVLLLCLMVSGCAPFAVPASTPTTGAKPVPADGAILGGTEAAFTQKYGPPSAQGGVYVYRSGTPTGVVVRITLGVQRLLFGPLRGQSRVRLVYARPDGEWTPQEAETAYRAFLPQDSAALRSTPQGGGARYLYRSASLAATFTQSALLDASGKGEPPGTFEVLCGRGIFGSGSGSDAYTCLIQG